MILALEALPDCSNHDFDLPATSNSAVALCLHLWKTTHQQSLAAGKTNHKAGADAASAFCAAIPPLSGKQNITDYIACIGHAVALEIIDDKRAELLLMVAKIALIGASKQHRSKPSEE